MRFKVGDKVVVNKTYNLERRNYPWYPDLAGKQGVVVEAHREIEGVKADMPLYKVKFPKSFLVGVVPEGQSAFGWKAKDWTMLDTWLFCWNLD